MQVADTVKHQLLLGLLDIIGQRQLNNNILQNRIVADNMQRHRRHNQTAPYGSNYIIVQRFIYRNQHVSQVSRRCSAS